MVVGIFTFFGFYVLRFGRSGSFGAMGRSNLCRDDTFISSAK